MTTLSAEALRLIVTPPDLRERIGYLRELGCHLIAPAGESSYLAQSFAVSITIIDIDANPAAGDVWQDPSLMVAGQWALSRRALQFIALGAGVKWLPTSTCISDPSVLLLWRFRADAVVRGYDGQEFPINGTSEVDTRDGSPQIGGWSVRKWRFYEGRCREALRARRPQPPSPFRGWDELAVRRHREHGLRLSETKAKNAAIRALGLKSAYTEEELSRPFVAFKVVYIPDMSIPEIRMSVHEYAMNATALLYGQRAAVGQ